MKPLVFWLPKKDGLVQEVIIPGDYVEEVMVRAAEHEAGHIVAAHHFGGKVYGIAVEFLPDQQRMALLALYSSKNWLVETQCVVKAAGPAADLLLRGVIDEVGASGDLTDIEMLTGQASLEPFLEQAKDILSRNRSELNCIAGAMREALADTWPRTLGFLPDKRLGALLLDSPQLERCLGASFGQL